MSFAARTGPGAPVLTVRCPLRDQKDDVMPPADTAKTAKQAETEEIRLDLQADITALRADLEALALDVGDLGRVQLDRAKASASDLVSAGEEMIDDLDRNLAATMRDRPVRSLAMAFGAGYLFALLTRR